MLNVPKNSTVSIYNSGCWYGGFFWLRKEHYDISMQMGRILYFKIRSTAPTTTMQQQVPVAVIKF
jgi:hypothetical protein